MKFIFSGHCHRNYEARVRRPVVPKTPPRPITADVTPTPTGASTENAPSDGETTIVPGGEETPSPDPPAQLSSTGVAAASSGFAADGIVNDGEEGAGAPVGGALLTEEAVAGLGSAAAAAAGGATRMDSRTGGDVDSDDAPGSISDNDEVLLVCVCVCVRVE